MAEVNEYRVTWTQCPTDYNSKHVLFVEAGDEDTARAVAKDHIERTTGIGWFVIHTCEPYTRPMGGKVVVG